ncbi:MAG TPA: hypothetical protein VM198_01600 [Longimicrobiales bacterium]|nr:hypothetical protein [Longimicrobiales bacterium]
MTYLGRRCAVGVALVSMAACDDPTAVTWVAAPDTVLLYSIASPISNLPNAFDFIYRTRWLVESADATGSWDVALGSDAEGFMLLPPGALGVSSYAGIWELESASINDLVEAPTDTTVYVQDTAVPLALGNAYVIRTRQLALSDGSSCAYYAKAQLVSADLAEKRVRLLFDRNPACYDRGLVPDS